MRLKTAFLLLLLPLPAFAETSSMNWGAPKETANQFSIEYGVFTNTSSPSTSHLATQFLGLGIRYSRTLLNDILMKRSSIRDFAAVEAGFFSYQVLGFYENSDSTLVFPTVLTLRYGLTFAKIFEPYLYGGLMKNFAIAQSPNAGVAQASLSSLRPAFGAGVAVKFKGFLARGDYGYDMLGAGVGYQF